MTWIVSCQIPPSLSDPESVIERCFEFGAGGAHVISDSCVDVYTDEEPSKHQDFKDNLKQLGLEPTSIRKLEEKNWVQEATDSWEDIACENITIAPWLTEDKPVKRAQGTIYIKPGTGFGTGHHATTFSLIGLLQKIQQTDIATEALSILDLGTGSGILALIAAQLFPNAQIDAVDNDPLALENAQCNLELNSELRSKIKLSHAQAADSSSYKKGTKGQYDLVIANIYAEVLCQLEPLLQTLTKKGAPLLISGIMFEKLGLIEDQFSSTEWKKEESVEKDGWVALYFTK